MKNCFHPLLLTSLCLLAGPVLAAADPTQPPAAWLNAANETTAMLDSGSPRLQSVLLPKNGKGVAVIGGETVRFGGLLGEAKLIGLSEREAVLKGPDGVIHLYLTPSVEKQMIVPAGLRKPIKTGHGKDSR